jgi:hypothetical protein
MIKINDNIFSLVFLLNIISIEKIKQFIYRKFIEKMCICKKTYKKKKKIIIT